MLVTERAAKAGNKVNLSLGFSHPVEVEPPTGISLEVPAPNKIVVSGINKEEVGAMAAKIRGYREPEPYKGKKVLNTKVKLSVVKLVKQAVKVRSNL